MSESKQKLAARVEELSAEVAQSEAAIDMLSYALGVLSFAVARGLSVDDAVLAHCGGDGLDEAKAAKVSMTLNSLMVLQIKAAKSDKEAELAKSNAKEESGIILPPAFSINCSRK